MYDTARDLLDAIRATPETLQYLLRGVGDEQARAARGGDEGWSVIEVLCHLRDAEERGLERMRAMRDTNNPHLAGYDQEKCAIERNYAAASLADALSGFLRLRAQHVAELEALPVSAWQRTGQHADLRTITITGHTLHLVSHDAIHLAQISRQLAAPA
jgi:hypothetical protein